MRGHVIRRCMQLLLLSHAKCRVMRPITRTATSSMSIRELQVVIQQTQQQLQQIDSETNTNDEPIQSQTLAAIHEDPFMYFSSGTDTIKQLAHNRMEQQLAQRVIADAVQRLNDLQCVR